ncbi:Hypothetical predicted protein [Podarcis lilfordi]|uniref:Uncharacterized protein n=1 Tax=Podarcis lilfordi TaxID=74358 RepID=A0AA35K5W0_9SAUR|nr:Hypothetical predicted protein [Podarcis lilfordi]
MAQAQQHCAEMISSGRDLEKATNNSVADGRQQLPGSDSAQQQGKQKRLRAEEINFLRSLKNCSGCGAGRVGGCKKTGELAEITTLTPSFLR